MSSRRQQHPAFTYAALVSVAGGAGYLLKGHLPSFVGGTLLGLGFLGAGMLVLTDRISDHQFKHSTSVAMSSIITGVMTKSAMTTRLRFPAMLAGCGAVSTGYHLQRLGVPPTKNLYVLKNT